MSILMLCSVIEGGKKKCEQYWPLKVGEKVGSVWWCGFPTRFPSIAEFSLECLRKSDSDRGKSWTCLSRGKSR